MGHHCPWRSTSGNEVKFKPISLDMLVDSPVVSGEFYRSIDITPEGEPIHHVDGHCGGQRRCAEHEPEEPEGDDQPGCGVRANCSVRGIIATTTFC